MPKALIRKIGAKVKGMKVGNMVTTIVRTTSTGVTTVTEMIGIGPMSFPKIVKLLLGMVKIVWRELRIYCPK